MEKVKNFETTKIGWLRAMFFKFVYGDPIEVEAINKVSKKLRMKVFKGWFIDKGFYYTDVREF